jgi:hypothetical protein
LDDCATKKPVCLGVKANKSEVVDEDEKAGKCEQG